jgi:large subunit GTPase 1
MIASGAKSIGIESENETSTNMKSVLEMDDLEDFLHRAALADKEFQSEREQFTVIDATAQEVSRGGGSAPLEYEKRRVQWEDEMEEEKEQRALEEGEAARFAFRELSVPRRPKWDKNTTPEELDQNERESFLNWRRSIAMQEEKIAQSKSSRITVTPFERNIEVWRQLWRVLERSDTIVLVVDGRNPLFYISTDLRTYVKELEKEMIVVINKCDYLTSKQRKMWNHYFVSLNVEHVFFSAYNEQEILDANARGDFIQEEQDEWEVADVKPRDNNANSSSLVLETSKIGIEKPLSRRELIRILLEFSALHNVTVEKSQSGKIEFGMVGFPNVGKSSVLNVLVGASKNDHSVSRVAVAAQPGKTKHFQTLKVPDHENIILCDCPGLVFPSCVSSSADLALAGVYPLAQVRDYWPAIDLICRRFPREILEAQYVIELPKPSALDMRHHGDGVPPPPPPPSAEDLLGTYCVVRSLLAPSSGIPDYHRAARVFLRDYVTGKLLYCQPPPVPASKSDEGYKQWEDDFLRETLSTTLRNTEKLRNKLGLVENAGGEFVIKKNRDSIPIEQSIDTIEKELNLEDDLDILDMIGVGAEAEKKQAPGGNRGKKHKSMQKWGKKGRKQRNKDPYGCHTNPDEEVFGSGGKAGLIVNAGKYTSSMYTRPNYNGARSASSFGSK